MSRFSDWTSMVSAVQPQVPIAVGGDCGWSGSELLLRAAGASEWMTGQGIPFGAAVPALLHDSGNALALLMAGAHSRRPLAPLGPRLTEAELVACVERLGAPVLLSEPQFDVRARRVAAATRSRIAVVRGLPTSGEIDPLPGPDDVALILHTSGTTGLPKAVHYRQRHLLERVRISSRLTGLGRGCVFSSAAPLHHIAGAGNLMIALAVGATIAPLPHFSVPAWRDLARDGVTHAVAVPTMIELLLREGALGIPSLKMLIYGGSPIHPRTLDAAMTALPGRAFLNLFGQTEGSPLTFLSPADHRRAAAGRRDLLLSVGRPAPGVELRIDQGASDEVASGVGEILVRGAHLPHAAGGSWHPTGDVGRQDAEGYVYLSGRRNDRIIRGGENVYPAEVENALLTHPDVREVAVKGVPDPVYGESVAAFVVWGRPGSQPDPEELRRHARQTLAGFKVPTQWSFVRSLPRNGNGKVLRRELRL